MSVAHRSAVAQANRRAALLLAVAACLALPGCMMLDPAVQAISPWVDLVAKLALASLPILLAWVARKLGIEKDAGEALRAGVADTWETYVKERKKAAADGKLPARRVSKRQCPLAAPGLTPGGREVSGGKSQRRGRF